MRSRLTLARCACLLASPSRLDSRHEPWSRFASVAAAAPAPATATPPRLRRVVPRPCLLLCHKLPNELATPTDPDGKGRPLLLARLRTLDPPVTGTLSLVAPLDFSGEGLVLATNDGQLAQFLESRLFDAQRLFRVRTRGRLADHALRALARGGASVSTAALRPPSATPAQPLPPWRVKKDALRRDLQPLKVSLLREEASPAPSSRFSSPPSSVAWSTPSRGLVAADRPRPAQASEDGASDSEDGSTAAAGLSDRRSYAGAARPGHNVLYSVSATGNNVKDVRDAFARYGVSVTKLTRIAYGPFSLGRIPRGAVLEVRVPPELLAAARRAAARQRQRGALMQLR